MEPGILSLLSTVFSHGKPRAVSPVKEKTPLLAHLILRYLFIMARHNERITCLIIWHQQPTPITSGAWGSATVRTQLSGGLAMVAAEGWTAGSVVPNRPQERGLLIRRKTTDLPPTLFYSKEHKEPYRGAPTLASPGFHGLELHGTLPAPHLQSLSSPHSRPG